MKTGEIQKLFQKSDKTLQAARLLLENGFVEDSISCAYYSIFYASKAVLLIHDIIITKSHRALRNAFGKYLIKTGELEEEWGKILSKEYDQRIIVDYQITHEPPEDLAEKLLKDAECFIQRMEQYIESKEVSLDK